MASSEPGNYFSTKLPDKDIVVLNRGGDSSVTVHKHGATVISWICHGEELLFCSKKAVFDNKKAIRGGIPLVFPQFGPWSLGPQHGFARIKRWAVEAEPARDLSGNVTASFCLTDDEETQKMWDTKFKLIYTVCLQDSCLLLSLEVVNTGSSSFDFTTLMHTYFLTSDVTQTAVKGLSGLKYIDKVKDGAEFTEDREEVVCAENYDRVYQSSPPNIYVAPVGNGTSQVHIKTTNLPDIVVWNPWAEKAKAMADFGDDEYPKMLCVEAGSVSKSVTIKAGEKLDFSQIITMAKL